jgi:hypothetical protein
LSGLSIVEWRAQAAFGLGGEGDMWTRLEFVTAIGLTTMLAGATVAKAGNVVTFETKGSNFSHPQFVQASTVALLEPVALGGGGDSFAVLAYHPALATTVNTPAIASFGNFALVVGNSASGAETSNTFNLDVSQTAPTLGGYTDSAALSARITYSDHNSLVKLVFSETAFIINRVEYTLGIEDNDHLFHSLNDGSLDLTIPRTAPGLMLNTAVTRLYAQIAPVPEPATIGGAVLVSVLFAMVTLRKKLAPR